MKKEILRQTQKDRSKRLQSYFIHFGLSGLSFLMTCELAFRPLQSFKSCVQGKRQWGLDFLLLLTTIRCCSSLPAPSEEKGYLEDKKNRMLEALWDKNNRSGGTKMKSNASNLQNEKRNIDSTGFIYCLFSVKSVVRCCNF